MAEEYAVELVSTECRDGQKMKGEYSSLELARSGADALANWLVRKGYPGSARVLFDNSVVYQATAGRTDGRVVGDAPHTAMSAAELLAPWAEAYERVVEEARESRG